MPEQNSDDKECAKAWAKDVMSKDHTCGELDSFKRGWIAKREQVRNFIDSAPFCNEGGCDILSHPPSNICPLCLKTKLGRSP